MGTNNCREPGKCLICGHYLTTIDTYAGYRCLDPGHWQAAGLLASRDFLPMARLAAQAQAEPNTRLGQSTGG